MMFSALAGLAVGAAIMLGARQFPMAILVVPVAVAIGPLLMARNGKPSKVFLTLYILLSGVLFTLMALTGPGFLSSFDPP